MFTSYSLCLFSALLDLDNETVSRHKFRILQDEYEVLRANTVDVVQGEDSLVVVRGQIRVVRQAVPYEDRGEGVITYATLR